MNFYGVNRATRELQVLAEDLLLGEDKDVSLEPGTELEIKVWAMGIYMIEVHVHVECDHIRLQRDISHQMPYMQGFYAEVISSEEFAAAKPVVYIARFKATPGSRRYLVAFGDQDPEKTTTQAILLQPLTSSGCNLHLCHGMTLPVTTLISTAVILTLFGPH